MHERVEAILSLEGKAIAHEFVRLLASLLNHFISINSLNIINSFLINVPIFYPHENTRKSLVFWCLQEV